MDYKGFYCAVSAYRAAGTKEYAAQYARAAREDGHSCPCIDGWMSTPFDVWVACPGCPQGRHPEDDSPE